MKSWFKDPGRNRRGVLRQLNQGRRFWYGRSSSTALDPGVDVPLLDAGEVAELALQAVHLAHAVHRREVHDHHAGDWPSAWLGRGLDFEESRPYSPGDDIRDMDWRTTARLSHPYLKTYREERQPMLHVVLDRGPSMRFGTRRRLKAAQAARLALLVAFAAAERNAAVSATLWDTRDEDLPPRHGRAGLMELIRAAAAPCPPLPPEAARSLHDADRLERLAADLPRGTRLLLVSDFTWIEGSHEPALARLAYRLDAQAVQILDPAERALPDVGLAPFQDLAGGRIRWLDTGSPSQRAAHAADFAERQARLAGLFVRTGLVHRILPSEADDLIPGMLDHA